MFTHYRKYSELPMAWSSCHCEATKSHFVGEEIGPPPRSFYKILNQEFKHALSS